MVVICFQISIFEPLETADFHIILTDRRLWFAFKLVSLNHWKQRISISYFSLTVVICFQISIFEPLETALVFRCATVPSLWFAFKLVSLNHWKQLKKAIKQIKGVVICFQISIFEPLETAPCNEGDEITLLWFAFKLVSLNHWKQHSLFLCACHWVVICFQISIFEPLETALSVK